MVEGTRPGLTLPQGTPPADPCNKVGGKGFLKWYRWPGNRTAGQGNGTTLSKLDAV
jgi:hypothetical protein